MKLSYAIIVKNIMKRNKSENKNTNNYIDELLQAGKVSVNR